MQEPGLYSMFFLPIHFCLQTSLLNCKVRCEEPTERRETSGGELKENPKMFKQTRPPQQPVLTQHVFNPASTPAETLIHGLVPYKPRTKEPSVRAPGRRQWGASVLAHQQPSSCQIHWASLQGKVLLLRYLKEKSKINHSGC